MGTEARARLGLAALILATLFSFEQLFRTAGYFWPTLVGALAAAGIAMAARRTGLSGWVALLAAVGGLVMYSSIVFAGSRTFYGLPTFHALETLGEHLGRAARLSNVDFAPVPLRPGYVIATVAAFWLLTAIGEVATFRWRRPLVATAPAVALFALVQVVGTGAMSPFYVTIFLAALLTYWALESAHRLDSWGRWVGAWRNEAPETSVTGALARRMGGACLVVALAVPLFLPALEEGLVAWRNPTGPGATTATEDGAGGSGNIDTLVSVVPRLINNSDTELFRATLSGPRNDLRRVPTPYWRLEALENFDGENWTPVSETAGAAPRGADFEATSDVALGQQIEIEALEGNLLPHVGTPSTAADAQGNPDGIQVNVQTGDLAIVDGLEPGFAYRVESTTPAPTYGQLDAASVSPPRPETVALPDGMDERIERLAVELTRGEQSAFDKLVALQTYLRSDEFTYDTDVDAPPTSDHLAQFLFEEQRGYCQQFATAFAVLARSLGYPTRVVVGFLPGDTAPDDPASFVIRGTHTHAWPEVFFANIGWVTFDPTPRQLSSAPTYTSEPVSSQDGAVGSLGNRPRNERVRDPGLNPDTLAAERAQAAQEARRRQVLREQRLANEWRRDFARLARWIVALLLLFLAGVPLLKHLRTELRYRRARTASARAAAAFAEFEAEATELARLPRPASETPRSYVGRVARERSLPPATVQRLAQIYEMSQYSTDGVGETGGEEARRIARQLRRRLWQEASTSERAARLFSPGGLRRSA